MPLGTVADRRANTRYLGGNLTVKDISDADLDKKLDLNDLRVKSATNKFDWNGTEVKFPMFALASDKYTAADVLEGLPNPTPNDTKKMEDLRADAANIIKQINNKDIQTQPSRKKILYGGVNVTDELDPANYTQAASTN